jgi:hypothetical protein
MRSALCAGVALVLGAVVLTGQKPTERQEWIQLFNGRNLDGWTPKIKGYALGENYAETFRVVDGVLQAAYDKYTTFDNKFGHLFYKDKFSHYIIAAEYRFVGTQVPGGPEWAIRNNGLMLHSQAPDTMGKDHPDLRRDAAARRSAKWQAALHRKHVLARYAGVHQ